MMRTATGSRENMETYWSNMSMIIAIDYSKDKERLSNWSMNMTKRKSHKRKRRRVKQAIQLWRVNRLVRVQNPDGTYMETYMMPRIENDINRNGKYNRYIIQRKGHSMRSRRGLELERQGGSRTYDIAERGRHKNAYYYIHNVHGDITALPMVEER